MKLNASNARRILRLPLENLLEPTQVEQAFHKMARRYPIEQFPEKFSELREAYQVLTDPTLEIRSLLFDDTIDLSWILEQRTPLNPEAQTEVEAKLLRGLSALLRENFTEILDASNWEEDDWDDEHMIRGLASAFGDGTSEFDRVLRDLMDSSRGKKAGKRFE